MGNNAKFGVAFWSGFAIPFVFYLLRNGFFLIKFMVFLYIPFFAACMGIIFVARMIQGLPVIPPKTNNPGRLSMLLIYFAVVFGGMFVAGKILIIYFKI